MATAVRGSRKPQKLPEVLTPDELTELVRAAKGPGPSKVRNFAMVLVMSRCGLRVAEVCALQVKDVTADSIHVRQGKGSKDRTVPLDPQTKDAIETWRAVRKQSGIRSHTLFTTISDRKEGEATIGERVVDASSEPGKALSTVYCRQFVKRYGLRAGLAKDIHPHTLRHTAATNWLRAGFSITEVQRMLGHSSLAMTMIYLHIFDAELQAKQQALPPLAV